jgi:TP901-1 family phage major tail protein
MSDISGGYAGRDITLLWDGADIGGVKEKTIKVNGEAIDVTSDDDDGWRKLLTVPAQRQVDISVSGVTKNNILKSASFDDTKRTKTASIQYPDGSTISGTFYLSEYSDKGSFNDATAFEATLQSSGPCVFTPAP